jgi:hypothetical protein
VAAPIDELANALARGCGVVVKVDFTPGGGLNEHWVRVLKFDGDDALIMDPWMQPGSEVIWMMPRYAHYTWGNPSRSIFRAAIYAPEGVELGSEVDTPEAFSAHVIGGAGEREEERYQQMALYRRPMGFWKKVFGR